MMLFGPAGAYILGGLSSIFGATQGNIITNQIDKVLDPDRDDLLCKLSNDLLETCNAELNNKIDLLNQKINTLSSDGISSYIRFRLTWDKINCQIAIKRNESLVKMTKITGTKKIFKALKLASESTVHPYSLQRHYHEIANILNHKIDRVDKTSKLFNTLIEKRFKN